VAFAERFASFHKKPLSFQVFLTQRAVETLRVIVVVQCLHPSVSCLYWEATVDTLGGEQFIPIFLAVGQTIFKIKWRVGKYFSAVSTGKTLRVECFSHCLQAVLSLNFFSLWFGIFVKAPFSKFLVVRTSYTHMYVWLELRHGFT